MSTTRKCEGCGAKIPAERVEALPDTQVCVKCAQAMGGCEFEFVPIEERTSKVESYKSRTSIVGFTKVRKLINRKKDH